MPRNIMTLAGTLKPPPTVTRWSQNTFLAGRQFGRNGVCAPLAGVWLRCRIQHENFGTYIRTPEAREEVMWLKEQQIKNSDGYMRDFMGSFGVRTMSIDVIPPMRTEEGLVAAKNPGYFIFGISSQGQRPPPTEGHAIAVDGMSHIVFDPNHGQLKCGSPRVVQDLLFSMISEYYEDMKFGRSLVYKFLKA